MLVLASPISDINIHAWDLNRVQRFLQLDIGVRVELCPRCVRNKQERSITFIMEKMFIKDCVRFLCREARIALPPSEESGFTVYTVPHRCFNATPTTEEAATPTRRDMGEVVMTHLSGSDTLPPPPYSEDTPPPLMPKGISPDEDGDEHDYDIAEFVETPATMPLPKGATSLDRRGWSRFRDGTATPIITGATPTITGAVPTVTATTDEQVEAPPTKKTLRPAFHFPEEVWEDTSPMGPAPSIRSSSFTESLFLSDGVLTATTTTSSSSKSHTPFKSSHTHSSSSHTPHSSSHAATSPELPPRTIPRRNQANSHLYANLHSHLFNSSTSAEGRYDLETPYQISSRITITDSGEVKYERSILGNTPAEMSGKVHFRKSMPLPPRGGAVAVRKGGQTGLTSEGRGSDGGIGGGEVEGRKRGVDSEANVEKQHSDISVGRVSISTTLSSAIPQRVGLPLSSSPSMWPQSHDCVSHSLASPTSTEGPPPSPLSPPVLLSPSQVETNKPPLTGNNNTTGSSLVTTVFSTKPVPPSPSPSPSSSSSTPLAKKYHQGLPPHLPLALNRSTSESRAGRFAIDRGQKRPSFTNTSKLIGHTSSSTSSSSSQENYEDDCYVIIRRLSSSQRVSASSPTQVSPSYVREEELPRIMEGGTRTLDPGATAVEGDDGEGGEEGGQAGDDVFEERLSLVGAGQVIRRDWIASLSALRLEQTCPENQHQLPADKGKMDIHEVAYFDYKKKLRRSKRLSSDYVVDSTFQFLSSMATPSSTSPRVKYDNIGWRTDSSSSDDDETDSHVSDEHHTPASTRVGSDGGMASYKEGSVVSFTFRPRSSQAKPTIRPRTKHRNAASYVEDSDSIPKEKPKLHSSSASNLGDVWSNGAAFRYKAGMDYVESSIPIPVGRKPIPVPRTIHSPGVKSSAKASMVTMGIGHMSSSEGDLLEAVSREEHLLSPAGGPASWGRPLHNKFHSSTDISSS